MLLFLSGLRVLRYFLIVGGGVPTRVSESVSSGNSCYNVKHLQLYCYKIDLLYVRYYKFCRLHIYIDTTTDLYLDGLSRFPLSGVSLQVWTIYGFYVIKLYRFVSHWCIYKPVASNN